MRYFYTLLLSTIISGTASAQETQTDTDSLNQSIILKFNSMSEELMGQIDSLLRSIGINNSSQGRYPMWMQQRIPGSYKGIPAIERPFLGIVFESAEQSAGEPGGAKVLRVVEGSAADKSGLESGDIIFKIDNKDISGIEDIVTLIDNKKAGDNIKIAFIREGKENTTSATLLSREEDNVFDRLLGSGTPYQREQSDSIYNPIYGFAQKSRPKLGVHITTTNKENIKGMRAKRAKGPLVTEVDKGSPADKMGIKANDIIITLNSDPVENIDDLKTRIQNGKMGDALSITVIRNRKKLKLSGELSCYNNFWEPDEKFRVFKLQSNGNLPFTGDKESLEEEIKQLKERLKALEEEIMNKGE